jgi:hypothetical protein
MRVLLIEDDSATARSIELMLKSASFNVYTTDLGEEGIDLGLPPEKWSSLMYGLWPDGGLKNAKEATHG